MTDIEAGGNTSAEATTHLRGVKPDDGPFNGPHILYVGPGVGDSAPNEDLEGSVAVASRAGTGAVGIGRTGVAGYAESVTRDQPHIDSERAAMAGVIGVSARSTGPSGKSPGVFGDGNPGVRGDGDNVGVEGTSTTPQGIGVKGTSVNGSGVEGTGIRGVKGQTRTGVGVTGRAVGVEGRSEVTEGVGVVGYANKGLGGEFQALRGPQIRLVPHIGSGTYFDKLWSPNVLDIEGEGDRLPLPLPKKAQLGEIACLLFTRPHARDEPAVDEASLWLCVRISGPDGVALWQQILTGPQYPGSV